MGRELEERLRQAVKDPVLRKNVLRATDTSIAKRLDAVGERDDWEGLREQASAVRLHALDHLDHYLEKFVASARRAGAKVHFARDGRRACRLVTELARRRGCSRILKSKSMTSEEVGLGAALERGGFRPLETDLGEYIVQLAGEAPSHITAPALHRSAEEILDLFRHHGVLDGFGEPPADRGDLARWLSLAAREHLRRPLLSADLGITGGNFLVADTGTLVLLENEGNIRFTVTTPRIMVALVGIDKIVPRFADLPVLLRLLARSATGQRATTYVSLLTGALDELHIVLLDNGRVEGVADAEDREIFTCIRCGACLNSCPVYRTVGGHAYGWTYPGPIGALLSPLLRGRPEDHELPWLSTLCGACTEVCPVKIDIHRHLLRLRGRAVKAGRVGVLERAAFSLARRLLQSPTLYPLFSRLLRRAGPRAFLLGPGRAWSRHREPPAAAPRSFNELWGDHGS